MHDVLKLYFGLRAKCLWRMIKELNLMAVPALLIFSFLGMNADFQCLILLSHNNNSLEQE